LLDTPRGRRFKTPVLPLFDERHRGGMDSSVRAQAGSGSPAPSASARSPPGDRLKSGQPLHPASVATITVSFPDGARAELPAGTAAGKALQGHLDGVRGRWLRRASTAGLVDLTARWPRTAASRASASTAPRGATSTDTRAPTSWPRPWPTSSPARSSRSARDRRRFYYDFDVEKPFTPETSSASRSG